MADVERAIRSDPRTTASQIAFLDRVQERRNLVSHLERRHNRLFRTTSYVQLEELQQVHRVLHEDDV